MTKLKKHIEEFANRKKIPLKDVVAGISEIAACAQVALSTIRRAEAKYREDCPIESSRSGWVVDKKELKSWCDKHGIGHHKYTKGRKEEEPQEFLELSFDLDGQEIGEINELQIAEQATRNAMASYAMISSLLKQFKIDKQSLRSPAKMQANLQIFEKFAQQGKKLQDQLQRLAEIKQERGMLLSVDQVNQIIAKVLDLFIPTVKEGVGVFIAELRAYEIREYGEIQTDSDIMSHIMDEAVQQARRKLSELLAAKKKEES